MSEHISELHVDCSSAKFGWILSGHTHVYTDQQLVSALYPLSKGWQKYMQQQQNTCTSNYGTTQGEIFLVASTLNNVQYFI